MTTKPRTRPAVTSVLIALLAAISLGMFAVPAFVIRPFRYQSERALAVAIAFKRFSPGATVLCLAAILAICLWKWSGASKRVRTGYAFAALLALGSAVMVRQNYFEWMFNPIAAGFSSVGDTKLDDGAMVMAVKIGSDARAYPIVQMAYHHIVNDRVANEPIVVTY